MKKISEKELRKLANMREAKERKRAEYPYQERPPTLPLYRRRITVEDFDFGYQRVIFHLYDSGRVDSYTVVEDGAVLSWRIGFARIWGLMLERFKRVSAV